MIFERLKQREANLQQENETLYYKQSLDIEKIVSLEEKNQELKIEVENFKAQFDFLSHELEEKKKKELDAYSQNLANINKVLTSSKTLIIALKEDNEKTKAAFKNLNDDYQTLTCKNSRLIKSQDDMNYKFNIINV